MIAALRKILGYQMTIAEWIGIALILAVPYLIVGVIWSSTHTEHLGGRHGVDLVVSFLGAIVSWPALLVSDICMT